MLSNQYTRTGTAEDLEEAISNAQRVVDMTPEDHPELPALLDNLATLLSTQFDRTKRMEDIEVAIQVAQRALDISADDHPGRAARLTNLATNLQYRYNHTRLKSDLEEAIRVIQRALDSTFESNPVREGWLRNQKKNMLRIIQACAGCGNHPSGQTCLWQMLQIPLGLRGSGRKFGSITISSLTSDVDLGRQLLNRYREHVKLLTRITRVYTVSRDLYTVSEISINSSVIGAKRGLSKGSVSGYDILEVKFGLRSADIIDWWQEQQDPTALMLYMEEKFSPIRFSCIVFLLLSSAATGGGIFTAYKASETFTQSWLAVVSLLFAVLFFGLSPCLMRRL